MGSMMNLKQELVLNETFNLYYNGSLEIDNSNIIWNVCK